MTNQTDTGSGKPAYVPWKTFVGYLAALKKGTTVPHTLDNTARPQSMAGGLWNQLVSGLQFIGLINANKESQDSLHKLVKSHGSSDWKTAVKDCILPAYKKVTGDLPIENATAGHLEKRFRENGKVDGQMLEKCIRFYIHVLKDSGVKYSSYFGMRKDKGQTRKGSANKRKRAKDETFPKSRQPPSNGEKVPSPKQMSDSPPASLIEQSLFFKGKPTGSIRVPADLSVEDCKVIELQLAVLKAYAAQGGSGARN